MAQPTRTRTQKSTSVHLDYLIHIEEIRPWPPTQSLRTVRALLIQWEHGDKSSGLTNQVVPSLGTGTGPGDGKIEFNTSFKLPVTLTRDVSIKRKSGDVFHKNCIEFNLYEPRREKAVKGQLLGTAVLDLAAHSVVKESLRMSVPINCKRTYWNAAQPLLYLKIQLVDKGRNSNSSTRESLMKEDLLDRNNYDSVSVLSEEYAGEGEGASITTDDDISSHSSLGVASAAAESNGSLSPQTKKSSAAEEMEKQPISNNENSDHEKEPECNQNVVNGKEVIHNISKQYENTSSPDRTEEPTTAKSNLPQNALTDDKTTEELKIYLEERSILEEKEPSSKENSAASISVSNIDSSKNGKSVRSVQSNECKDALTAMKDSRTRLSDSKIQHLENRISILEGELREAATMEVSLYSVVAEHGSSMTKVNAPARRLSRSYSHASTQSSKSRRSAAKSIVSGLVLVSKACGNDVPRLTFWLSNCIVLRMIVSKSFAAPGSVDANGKKKSSLIRWESFPGKSAGNSIEECFGDWENPQTFVAALEKVEAWIFSRIIESLWWQTFTPHMQSGNAEEIRSSMDAETNKKFQRTSSSIDQQQGNFSMELWKMAFRDACEKICPVRAGGHDCGCLPVLSRVIMEQLIARLDVAMFNAILRESADEIPTDPVADPISDPEVLPIPAGKASFGAGAQLKTAIGNWSRWLTDLFGIDDAVEDKCDLETADNDDDDDDDDDDERILPSKSFRLLNALSDLMMLPKDLLLSRAVRKEVCPTFGPPIVVRALNSFVPDEFCPDPIPAVVFEALNSEDHFDREEGFIVNFPCSAAPIAYEPPSAAVVADILGEFGSEPQVALRRSRSSLVKKSQTSDDELDELDCPLESIIGSAMKKNGSGNVLRYRLLRDVWMSCD